MNSDLAKEISPVLHEIEELLWDHEAMFDEPVGYSQDELRSATKIFMHVLMDIMYKKQKSDDLPLEEMMKQAEKAGKSIRALIKEYTGLDSHDFYKTK